MTPSLLEAAVSAELSPIAPHRAAATRARHQASGATALLTWADSTGARVGFGIWVCTFANRGSKGNQGPSGTPLHATTLTCRNSATPTPIGRLGGRQWQEVG